MEDIFAKQVGPENVQFGEAMENSFQRFTHLPEKIFEHLDYVSIVKCREVKKSWQEYLDQGKVLHIKIIRLTVGKFHGVVESWEAAFKMLNTENTRELGILVKRVYMEENRANIGQGCDSMSNVLS